MNDAHRLPSYTLVISCPDKVGIVAAVSQFVAQHRGSLLESNHHTDVEQGWFYMRNVISARVAGGQPGAEFRAAVRAPGRRQFELTVARARQQGTPAGGGTGQPRLPLPGGSAAPLEERGAGLPDPLRGFQPREPAQHGGVARHTLFTHVPVPKEDKICGLHAGDGYRGAARGRDRGAGPVHADYSACV